MQIERLSGDDWRRLKDLRIRALTDAPDAFATTLAEVADYPDERWGDQLKTLVTFVAQDNGADLGMVRGVTSQADAAEAHLVSMWVAPEVRGRGVAERLVQAVIAWARDTGHTRLALEVADANLPAIALYDRMGFKASGETDALPPPRAHITEHRRILPL